MFSPFWTAGVAIDSYRSRMASSEASDAKRDARYAKTSAAELDARFDRLAMTCEALWTILREKVGVTDEELIDRITELDLTDGRLDGKVKRSAVSCPKCKRTIARRFPNCMYCGQAIMHDPFA